MLQIHYFAGVREALGRAGEQLPRPAGVGTVGDLLAYLRRQDAQLDRLLDETPQLLHAVNHTVVDGSWVLGEDDEVAFFPPMTGG